MNSWDAVCFLELTPSALRVLVSAEGELQQWQIEVPLEVTPLMQQVGNCAGAGSGLAALDALFSRATKSCNAGVMARVVLLTHSWGPPLLYTYALRCLHAAVSSATVVDVLPCPLFVVECAGVASALVVHGQDGVLVATPVQDGVVCVEAEVVWGSLAASSFADAPSADAGFDRVARCAANLVWPAASSSGSTRDVFAADSCELPTPELASADSLLHAVELQVAACRRRELHGALATVVLSGQAAALPAARRCVALLLSHVLPQSIVTWV